MFAKQRVLIVLLVLVIFCPRPVAPIRRAM